MSKLTILVTIIVLTFCVSLQGQSKKSKASIAKKRLTKIINKAETNHVMFNIKRGKLYILDARRDALKPKKYKAPYDEVFTVYTVNNVLNKIGQTNKKRIKFYKDESGAVRFDLDNGAQDLFRLQEETGFCPPGCSLN